MKRVHNSTPRHQDGSFKKKNRNVFEFVDMTRNSEKKLYETVISFSELEII